MLLIIFAPKLMLIDTKDKHLGIWDVFSLGNRHKGDAFVRQQGQSTALLWWGDLTSKHVGHEVGCPINLSSIAHSLYGTHSYNVLMYTINNTYILTSRRIGRDDAIWNVIRYRKIDSQLAAVVQL